MIALPVQNAESRIEGQKDHKIMPNQLEDAALPSEQEVPDAVEPVCGILVHVGVDARRQPKLLLPHVEDHAETVAKLQNCFIVSLI